MKPQAKGKIRADELLVQLKIAETRSKAQAYILAGQIFYKYPQDKDWRKLLKAGEFLLPTVEFDLSRLGPKDVGRGAQKLRRAFEHWPQLSAKDGLCLDVGASTGGFTQVLLEKGAAKVVALDVGTQQLHEKLRADPRVLSVEQQHVLKMHEEEWRALGISPEFDFIVTDLSFISLTKIMEKVSSWLKTGAYWVLLVKPQFELEPKKVPKGIVREDAHRQEAINKVKLAVRELSKLEWLDVIESPILGGDGNKEYLLLLRAKP